MNVVWNVCIYKMYNVHYVLDQCQIRTCVSVLVLNLVTFKYTDR